MTAAGTRPEQEHTLFTDELRIGVRFRRWGIDENLITVTRVRTDETPGYVEVTGRQNGEGVRFFATSDTRVHAVDTPIDPVSVLVPEARTLLRQAAVSGLDVLADARSSGSWIVRRPGARREHLNVYAKEDGGLLFFHALGDSTQTIDLNEYRRIIGWFAEVTRRVA